MGAGTQISGNCELTFDFDIAVFGMNEAATIGACLASLDRACAGRRARVSVLLNGTTDDSLVVLKSLRMQHAALTVWKFLEADKSNAINYFIYMLRGDAEALVFADAYVTVGEASLRAFEEVFRDRPAVLAVTGVPTAGRSAPAVTAATLRGGRLNGQFFALRPRFADGLMSAGYRLPAQLYRGDGLLGSMAAHNLDALGTPWDDAKIAGAAAATFTIRSLSPLRLSDIGRQYRREIRQARGRMENAAIRSIIYAAGYGGLPANADDMIIAWLGRNAPSSASLRAHYFDRLALRQVLQSRRIVLGEPVKLYETDC